MSHRKPALGIGITPTIADTIALELFNLMIEQQKTAMRVHIGSAPRTRPHGLLRVIEQGK